MGISNMSRSLSAGFSSGTNTPGRLGSISFMTMLDVDIVLMI